jgi:hypothetical protein
MSNIYGNVVGISEKNWIVMESTQRITQAPLGIIKILSLSLSEPGTEDCYAAQYIFKVDPKLRSGSWIYNIGIIRISHHSGGGFLPPPVGGGLKVRTMKLCRL